MRPTRLAEVTAAMSGSLRGDDGPVTGASVDGRSVGPGELFFALPGERVDGHAFVAQALRRGAAAAVVRRGWTEVGSVIEVDDPGTALLDLAAHERQNLPATVVGITGSTGKTSTKDLTASVLGRTLRVVASPASFNNEVGLPLTILRAGPDTEVVVCEMGARGPGHIRLLCRVARPELGVVTNVGVAHMGLFGSPEALRDAKAELPEALPEGGVAVLNADDPVVRAFAARTRAGRVILFGSSPDADVTARSIELGAGDGRARFELVTPSGSASVRLPVPGEHMVANALAASAVGWAMGESAQECATGLAEAVLSAGRMEVAEAGGLRILNDSYNANPTSMEAALRAARSMAGTGRCVAVLGSMAELGAIAALEHERVGELVARLGIDVLVAVGPDARLIAAGAQREGVEPDRLFMCEDAGAAAGTVLEVARPGDLVLVKASRVARLERVVEALLRGPQAMREAAP